MDLWNQRNRTIRMAKSNKILMAGFIVISSFMVSCSPKLHNNVLTFFFDGVPSPDTIKTSTDKGHKDGGNSEEFRSEPVEANNGFTVHYPYKEKECFSCHDEKSKSELILPQPDLCYSCHEDFSKKFKFIHGPVAGGYCTSCHNPHMSKDKNLLIRSGQQICLNCHESKSVLKNDVHKDIADSECTLCHNPHGGENRFILN
jgi:predicted CXXCH cytochrome family protein